MLAGATDDLQQNFWRLSVQRFSRLDAHRVIKPTVSKHWRNQHWRDYNIQKQYSATTNLPNLEWFWISEPVQQTIITASNNEIISITKYFNYVMLIQLETGNMSKSWLINTLVFSRSILLVNSLPTWYNAPVLQSPNQFSTHLQCNSSSHAHMYKHSFWRNDCVAVSAAVHIANFSADKSHQ